jgi:hypothetical protein
MYFAISLRTMLPIPVLPQAEIRLEQEGDMSPDLSH